MQFNDYMKYLDLACQMAGLPRYQWAKRSLGKDSYKLGRKVLLILGSIGSFYQIIGVFLYWYFYERMEKDTATFVAGIGDMCGSLMLTIVGFSNIYALVKNHTKIEALLEELHAIFPDPEERHYRCQHYYKTAIFIMQIEFRFYMIFFTYYNSAPLLMLLWEHQKEGQELSFRTQTNTWFPWRVHGSALGFGLGYLTIVFASCVGVGFSIATQNLVCLFAFQLKMHYDALASQLLNLDSRHPESSKKLRILIAYHIRILQIADQFNALLNFNFLSSLFGSTIAICMTSVAVLLLDLASAFKAISGLVAFVLYQFIICYLGTEVTLAIEGTLKKLQDLYPRSARQKHYCCQHYFRLPLLLMKLQYMFFVMFCVYHNGFSIFRLLWKYLSETQSVSFRAQTKSWYPWKVQGSAVGYGAAFL
ncbi:putative odorant receptor 69a [Drosophila serrata]|uniref:putative odorant receptor 69a n=1 Tax=Drosophila serrata TaxID=7274 RepID=UPI000A1D2162|nr:putative odorant receptor 69a [Drosophila serrata]